MKNITIKNIKWQTEGLCESSVDYLQKNTSLTVSLEDLLKHSLWKSFEECPHKHWTYSEFLSDAVECFLQYEYNTYGWVEEKNIIQN